MIEFLTGIVWDSKPGFAKVQLDEDDEDTGFTTDWLPMLFLNTLNDKEAVTLEKNTQVKVLITHNRREGVILGAIYSDKDTPPDEANNNTWVKKFADGTYISYDKQNGKLTADIKGTVDIKASGKITVNTDADMDATVGGDATITAKKLIVKGDLSVTGEIKSTGDISSNGEVTGHATSVPIKLTTHTHNVTAVGSPTGPALP